MLPDNFPLVKHWDGSVHEGMLPYDSFHWLRNMSPAKFEVHFGATGSVTWWWEAFRSSEEGRLYWDLHPWLRFKTPADLSHHLPLMAFDDGGVTGKGSTAFVRLWYSLLGRGADKETRVIMATAHKTDDFTDNSWPDLLASFERLSKPVGPEEWGGGEAYCFSVRI
jgi:hypothetical protein